MDRNRSTQQKIANRLKVARIKIGLRQSDVAGKAGINTNYYAKVERGDSKPSMETLEKIIKALKAKSSDILPF